MQNKAVVKVLGAFRGSPSWALEVEGAIPPPQARLENACNSYSLRLLAFQGNHPVLQALHRPVRDELAASSESDQALSSYLQPTTQLACLGIRLAKLVGDKWKISARKTSWEQPWAAGPAATITISNSSKSLAAREHKALLRQLLPSSSLTTALFYTDGSKGVIGGSVQNSASVCRIGPSQRPILARYWNLGPYLEVADCESIAIVRALEIAIVAAS